MAAKPQLTKQQRREAAREAARRLREEQERKEKRTRIILMGVITLVVILAAVAVFAILGQRGKSPFDDVALKPAGSDNSGGIPISKELVAGTPATEGVRVDLFTDYTCIHCNTLETVNGADARELVTSGAASVWIHPMALLDRTDDFSGFSGMATNAVVTVAHYSPEHFWDFHQKLFELYWGPVPTGQPAPGPTGMPEIQAAAKAVGVPDDVTDRFPANEFHPWLEAVNKDFLKTHRGTPVLLIDGTKFNAWNEPGAFAEAVRGAAGE